MGLPSAFSMAARRSNSNFDVAVFLSASTSLTPPYIVILRYNLMPVKYVRGADGHPEERFQEVSMLRTITAAPDWDVPRR